MKKYSFAFCTDSNYLKYTWSCIINLIATKSPNSFYKINLITVGEPTDLDLPKIKSLGTNIELKIIPFDSELLSDFEGIRHVSNAAFTKFFIPSLVDDDYVLYLDGDIYINSCIESIWKYKPKDEYLSAVWDPGDTMENGLIGISDDTKVFNTGVLLLNCKKMRNNHLNSKLMEFYVSNRNEIQNADQTVFNAVCKGSWKEVDASFNLQRCYYFLSHKKLKMTRNERLNLIRNPKIIHFTTHSKPWMYRCSNPFKKKYMRNYNNLFGIDNRYKKNIVNISKKVHETIQYLIAFFI